MKFAKLSVSGRHMLVTVTMMAWLAMICSLVPLGAPLWEQLVALLGIGLMGCAVAAEDTAYKREIRQEVGREFRDGIIRVMRGNPGDEFHIPIGLGQVWVYRYNHSRLVTKTELIPVSKARHDIN